MTVPNELPDIGSTAQRLRQNPRFDPGTSGIGTEDYFVWTRFDGATSVRDLILMTGLDTTRAIEIVKKLRALGAILLPSEHPDSVAGRLKAATPALVVVPPPAKRAEVPLEERVTARVSVTALREDVPLTAPTPEETAALAEPGDLTADERRRILSMHRRTRGGDLLAILGVVDRTDKKAIKRAYFAFSKDFHPDRFYGRQTGTFAERVSEIFEAMSQAYELLTDGARASRAKTPSPAPSSTGSAAQNPTDHAADLFDRACQAEVSGDRVGALRTFAALLRLAAPAKYLRRAARCAIQAGELPVALEYAKKAANLEPNDPSTARLLAHAFKASGKLADAEETLVLALMIKTENDQLTHELQADLAELRRIASR
jgi:hypothetical protein